MAIKTVTQFIYSLIITYYGLKHDSPNIYEIRFSVQKFFTLRLLDVSFPLQWSSLNVLDTFPSLVELKFKGNPVLQGEESIHNFWLVTVHIICFLFDCQLQVNLLLLQGN